jgi:hypothetical protein
LRENIGSNGCEYFDSTAIKREIKCFQMSQVEKWNTSNLLEGNKLYQIYFFLLKCGFELRALCLQSTHSVTWATSLVHYTVVILDMGVLKNFLPPLASSSILPISTFHVYYRYVPPIPSYKIILCAHSMILLVP